MTPLLIRALTFDVFGTVVDWRGSIIREGRALGKQKNLKVDWAAVADAWRDGYKPAMDRVRKRQLPWMSIDQLHRLVLDDARLAAAYRFPASMRPAHRTARSPPRGRSARPWR